MDLIKKMTSLLLVLLLLSANVFKEEATAVNTLNTISDENTEQVSTTISTTQLIEYDVTYSIISDSSLSMDIDYNVYNGNSENDTVSLIAALYENGRLSDIKTQSLSVNSLESNTDSLVLPLPNNREDYTVKLMVWEGMGTLRPIGNAKQVIDLDNYTREKYMYITSNANVDVEKVITDNVSATKVEAAKATVWTNRCKLFI